MGAPNIKNWEKLGILLHESLQTKQAVPFAWIWPDFELVHSEALQELKLQFVSYVKTIAT